MSFSRLLFRGTWQRYIFPERDSKGEDVERKKGHWNGTQLARNLQVSESIKIQLLPGFRLRLIELVDFVATTIRSIQLPGFVAELAVFYFQF